VRAPHPRDPARGDLFWLIDGRVVDFGAVGDGDVVERTSAALRRWDPRRPTTHVPVDEVDEVRIVASWVAANAPPTLALDPAPGEQRLRSFALDAG
jgi:hypothetical protein